MGAGALILALYSAVSTRRSVLKTEKIGTGLWPGFSSQATTFRTNHSQVDALNSLISPTHQSSAGKQDCRLRSGGRRIRVGRRNGVAGSLRTVRERFGRGFNEQQILLRLFDFALPPVDGFDFRDNVDAGGQATLHKFAGDLPAFFRGRCGSEDESLVGHIESGTADATKACNLRAVHHKRAVEPSQRRVLQVHNMQPA